jgi:hypothetical protein
MTSTGRLREALLDAARAKDAAKHIGVAVALAVEIESELRHLPPLSDKRAMRRFCDLCSGFGKAVEAAGIEIPHGYPDGVPPYWDALSLIYGIHEDAPRKATVAPDDDDEDDDLDVPVSTPRRGIIRRRMIGGA